MNWEALFSRYPQWESLTPALTHTLSASRHGDFPRWQAALAALPVLDVQRIDYGDTVLVDGPVSASQQQALEAALMQLHPWRKGPFRLFGVHLDTEWRSDWKWRRLAPHLPNLDGETVLDIGCGNGYFGWRLLAAGAALVAGVDPSVLFCMQHQAINFYLGSTANWLLPVTFEDLPPAQFDTVLSMGVLYHRRDPAEHLDRLFACTRPGGRTVVESLVVDAAPGLQPQGRYGRMRNVWHIPSTGQLCDGLGQAGFTNVQTVDVTPTSVAEQRTTRWMRFESLAEALDPEDANRTVEGHPAPVRAIVVGSRPT